jgi:hypothetical protein
MNTVMLIVIGLRAAALTASLAGQTKLAGQLYQLADFVSAGVVSDLHMKEVADKLAERNANDADFSDVLARIEQHRAELHSG